MAIADLYDNNTQCMDDARLPWAVRQDRSGANFSSATGPLRSSLDSWLDSPPELFTDKPLP